MAGRKGKATRRNKGFKKHLTIPEIKNAFDTVGQATHDILKEGGTPVEQVKKFQRVWKSVFHRPVGSAAAEAYLKMKKISAEKRPIIKNGNGTRKNKNGGQKGGYALAGAPLDYVTRAGVDTVYGNFPEYQSAGLKFYDTVNQQGMFQECGTKDITPNIYGSGSGSGPSQSGGTMSDYLHAKLLSPSAPGTPPNVFSNSQQALSGRPMGASPAPYQPAK